MAIPKKEPTRQFIATVKLSKTGGSLVMTIPAPARKALALSEGEEMSVAIEGGAIRVEPVRRQRPRYRLADLLAQCDAGKPYSDEEKSWAKDKPVGREIW